ncbi:MAG: diguanylate cyclase [Neptuniibacter sp.]
MKSPEIPVDEEKRLESLRSLNILDTAAEERFDRLTRLAKRLFNVPIALVSLVDENRQWFKSCMGLTASETGRDISFCGHTILGDDLFVIPDALEDERFRDNPLVTSEPYIRFYAGYPLKHINGQKLGTLCLIDTEPRQLSPEDVEDFKDLALMAERELAAVELATLDDLTQLSNKRGFSILACKALNYCSRMNVSATLMFLDLNGFKQINDTLGHKEGDIALRTFAAHMQKVCRDSDVMGRVGGDEFAVLMVDADQAGANNLVQRLSESLRQEQVDHNREYRVEFTAGIVDVTEQISVDELLDQADKQMYLNRNKVIKEPANKFC